MIVMNIEKELVRQSKRRGGTPRHKMVHDPPVSLVLDGELESSPEAISQSNEEPVISDKTELSPFSKTLRMLFKNHEAVTHLAATVEVAENTVYRWLKGETDPRPIYLHRLLQAYPEHHQQLFPAIQQTFPGVLDIPSAEIQEVQKDLYRHVTNLFTTTIEANVRRWHIIQAIFDYALLQLDAEHQGISITFAQLMPERADGIHSLYEATTYGTAPWPSISESHVYLGSTSLAGIAAMSQHVQTWDAFEASDRTQVEVDRYEQSACAHPVTRGDRLVGVLVVSSTLPGFFHNQIARQSVVEYAQLLSLAFPDDEFKPFTLLNLRPLPSISWQRAEISHSYVNRTINCARQRKLTRNEAELQVRIELELEFEQLVHAQTVPPDAGKN